MWNINYFRRSEGVTRKIIAAGGHRVAVAALEGFSTNTRVVDAACLALFRILDFGGAHAKAAVSAIDGVMDKLRHARDVMRAHVTTNYADWVLCQLGEWTRFT